MRSLFVGLGASGALMAGFGASLGSASAQDRVVVVTVLGGAEVRVTVPAGTPLDQVRVPGVSLPILSIREEGGPGGAPTISLPTPPAAQPAPAQPPADGAPADAPKAERQREQKTSGKAKRRARQDTSAVAESVTEKAALRAKRRSTLREVDGTPTPDNPGFMLALPGAAPIGVPNFFIEKFRIPPFLLPIYQAAGIEYGIRWEVLAAINEIETDYGRNLNVSSAGALGWMQFMPASWKAYGVDANRDGKKDPYNPVDAIFAAARYLKAAGADQDLKKAIFAYNHADWYVDSVLLRARLIGGLPADLVGSLTGLTQGHFPVHAKATYADDLSEADTTRKIAKGRNAAIPVNADAARRSIDIFAKAGSPAIAVQDGKIVNIGESERLGRFVQLQDVYGNTYTYANLKKLARGVPVPRALSKPRVSAEHRPVPRRRDPRPVAPASAGSRLADSSTTTGAAAARVASVAVGEKERLFANPKRPNALKAGGEEQVLNTDLLTGSTTFKSYFTQVFGLDRDEVTIKPLKIGSKVVAGTILGRIGTTSSRKAPHLKFEIRPAGRGAPRIDPKPVLDGWKLLESTAIYRAQGKNPLFGPDAQAPSIGQILLMSKEALQRRVAANPRIELYDCGRRDVRAGAIDRRVLATLEFLASSGLKPSVTSLRCGHGYFTKGGNVSHHSSGNAVDIARINGVPVMGNQGAGSVTELAIRRLLTLQGTMKPAQIISLMTFEGADNTMALPDHADHIHVGWQPMYRAGSKEARRLDAVLKPSQWIKLIDRLGQIDNPAVATKPSKYAITVPKAKHSSDAHRGE